MLKDVQVNKKNIYENEKYNIYDEIVNDNYGQVK